MARIEKTVTTYVCDICHTECVQHDQRHLVGFGYSPIEPYGVAIEIATFGIPVNEMVVCTSCQISALRKLANELETTL